MMKTLNTYTDKEKKEYIEEYRNSNLSIGEYTREKNIPASTFRGWLTREMEIRFGELNLEEVSPNKTTPSKTSTVFITDKIRIELKEDYDKNLLKSLMGVLLNNDK